MNFKKLVISIGGCLLVGFLGSAATFAAIPNWYATLNKPFFTPPNWLFGPVWTTLYILMGIAWFLVWKRGWKRKEVKMVGKWFLIQLVLNFSWSEVFFGVKNLPLSFVVIVFLWCMILKTMLEMKKVSTKSYWLMMPYLLWVSFASILNLAIVVLN